VAEREGDHLLDQHAGLVDHPGRAAFPREENLGAMAVQLPLPPVVVGGWIHHSAGGLHIAEFGSDGEHL
jgi:hypothetical protein